LKDIISRENKEGSGSEGEKRSVRKRGGRRVGVGGGLIGVSISTAACSD